jgi:hypothetical protein
VTFVAVTCCNSYQQVLTSLHVKCDLGFLLADLKHKHICINFHFKLRITARQKPQTKHKFVMIHKPNKSPLSGKCGLLYKRKKASPVKHQEHVDLSFEYADIVSNKISSSRPNG